MNDQTTTTGTASPLKRSVLKGKARASLLGHYMPLSSAFLSLAILQYIITAPSGLIQVHPPFGTILYYAVTFAISVFFGIFQVGITGLFLSNSCHQPVYAGGIFSGFWHEPLKAIQIQLVLSLRSREYGLSLCCSRDQHRFPALCAVCKNAVFPGFLHHAGLSRTECKGMLKTLQKAHERTQMAVFPPDGKLPALANGRVLNLRHRTAVCVSLSEANLCLLLS